MNALVNFNLCKLSDKRLIELVDKMTDEMFETGKIPTRHIPARPEEDYDLLVGELLKRFQRTTLEKMDRLAKRID